MNKTARIALASLMTAGAAAAGAFVLKDNSMSYDEYQAYIDMVNYEITRSGGKMTIENVHGRNDFIEKLNRKIEQREIVEPSAQIGGERLTKKEYKTLRNGLLKKK